MDQDTEMVDVEMGDCTVSPARSDSSTEKKLALLFELADSEADEDSEEEVEDWETECTICNKVVSLWLDLIIPEEGERLSKIENMSEAERDLARKPYCLECADAQVWYWQLVHVERDPPRRLTTDQWREVTIQNLRNNFGLLEGVEERLMIADYFKFCRGCNDLNARVETAGVHCRGCRGLERCSVCDRTGDTNVRIIQIQGVSKCMKCLGGKKRVVTFRLPAIAPDELICDDPEAEYDESMVSESEAE